MDRRRQIDRQTDSQTDRRIEMERTNKGGKDGQTDKVVGSQIRNRKERIQNIA